MPKIPAPSFLQGESASYTISDAYTDSKTTVSFSVLESSKKQTIITATEIKASESQEYRITIKGSDVSPDSIQSAAIKNSDGTFTPVKSDRIWFVPLFFFDRNALQSGYSYTSSNGSGTEYGYKINTKDSAIKYAFNASYPLFSLASATVKNKTASYSIVYEKEPVKIPVKAEMISPPAGGG